MTNTPAGFEVLRTDVPRGAIRHALFDFDGTLSLIREGWQGVMVPLMVRVLAGTPAAEPPEAIEALVRAYVDRTTGIQTIYQMMGLTDMVRERGGEPLPATAYKQQYLDELWERIKWRVAGLKAGSIPREDLMVPGAEQVLVSLAERGVRCYLASGTDLEYVRDEVTALGLADYFDGHIYGAVADLGAFSKAMVIGAILRDNDLHGHELVTFGDGYVEIEETVAVGGLTVGVASDEVGRSGRVDPWKRGRLAEAGAHIIVADFGHVDALLDYLFATD